MLVPISWLKQYVDITVPIEALAERMTVAGMEVAKIYYYGIPQQFVDYWQRTVQWDLGESFTSGRSVNDNGHRPPSVLVDALFDVLASSCADPEAARRQLIVVGGNRGARPDRRSQGWR